MKNVVGIVAEYNPFHNGHALHLEQTREKLGGDSAIVCVMSGDFVQRGEPAVYSKFTRAEIAARCGVDLVLELPLPWSLASAEGFARGAVGLLGQTGVVTHLSFGSEIGAIEPLQTLSEALLDPTLGADLRAELQCGDSFAVARQRVMEKRVGSLAKLLEAPNNILAVEYLKALYGQELTMKPVTIQRFGAAHDAAGQGRYRSASELRAFLDADREIVSFIPKEAADVLRRENEHGRGPVLPNSLETAILSRLRMLDRAGYAALPGADEGLGNALFKASNEEPTLSAMAASAKSKRYALSRIRRMMMCAALGVKAGMADGTPPYVRVLAATERGRELLRDINEKCSVPIITKPASARTLEGLAHDIFLLTAEAHDLYALGYPIPEERRAGGDWRHTPVML